MMRKWRKNFGFGGQGCQELAVCVGGVMLALTVIGPWPAGADPLGSHIEFLATHGPRTTGYPGAIRAAQYLEDRLLESGITELYRREFSVPVPVDRGAFLEGVPVPGSPSSDQGKAGRIKLYHMWPNLARTSTLPPHGLEGRLLYGNSGSHADLDGLWVEGSVIALEYNCGANWVTAFDLGARAVIFLEPARTHRKEGERKFLTTPADLPRFYAAGRQADRLRKIAAQGRVRIRLGGRMTWEAALATTLVGIIPGSDPSLRSEAVMVGCYYDAVSPVPAISPGAEQASGVAVWLEVARALHAARPRRTVILAATAGHFQSLAGMRDLVALLRQADGSALGARLDQLELAYFVGFDLSSHGSSIGLVQAGPPYRVRKIRPPIYGAIEAFAQQYEQDFRRGKPILGGELKPLRQRLLLGALPERIPVQGAVANLAGHLGLTFVTAGDMRAAFDSPLDLPEFVDLAWLQEQSAFLSALLVRLLNDPAAGPQISQRKDSFGTVTGRVLAWGKQAYAPNEAVAGALVRVRSRHHSIMGVRMDPLALSAADGAFSVAGVEARTLYLKPIQLEAFRTDEETGGLNFALDRGPFGTQQYPNEIQMDQLQKEASLVGFWCRPITLFDTFDPLKMKTLEQLAILDAGSEAAPISFGSATPATPGEIQRSGYFNSAGSDVEQVAVAFLAAGIRAKFTMTEGRFGIGRALVLLNGSRDRPTGAGFDPTSHPRVLRTGLQTAADTYELNAARFSNLRRHGINSPLLAQTHAATDSFLGLARAALRSNQYGRYADMSNRARSFARRTYNGVQALTLDVVRGVLFFLFLLLPVAYFGERLLFESTDLRRQVLGALGIFLVVFLWLRHIHPAFQLTISPFLILLGFVILALSLLVALMGISRLNAQVRATAAHRDAVHRADTDRTSLLLRALLIGIGQLRRRPWRTGLTMTTLVLLTFTMLSFTSIREEVRHNETRIGSAPAADALLVRHPGWGALEQRAFEYLRLRFGAGATAGRAWYRDEAIVEYGSESARARAALGLMPNEPLITAVDRALVAGRWFVEGEDEACILSTSMAARLGFSASDVGRESIRYLGSELEVVGLIDEEQFDRLRDVGGGPLTPLDEDAQQPDEKMAGRGASHLQAAFTHLVSAQVLILPYAAVRRWGEKAGIASVAVSMHTNGMGAAGELAEEISLSMFATTGGHRYLINAAGVQVFSGRTDIWIPVLIAALIVFNTMLGSVHERIGDIGVLNAVGLAPMHVAGLFLAEAAVYAVMSSALGYLLGQTVAKMGLFFGMFPGLTVNYSSLSAVATVAAVAAVVLLSTLYPARRAARICVPGIERTWRLPAPDGDTLTVPMPFALSGQEASGLIAFIAEYLGGHTEQSIGASFYVEAKAPDPGAPRAPVRAAELHCRLWLAPFDQGLSQDLELRPVAEEGAPFFGVAVVMRRRSGDRAAWLRANRLLLNQLRKQFLVWRSLTASARSPYLQKDPAA